MVLRRTSIPRGSSQQACLRGLCMLPQGSEQSAGSIRMKLWGISQQDNERLPDALLHVAPSLCHYLQSHIYHVWSMYRHTEGRPNPAFGDVLQFLRPCTNRAMIVRGQPLQAQ